MIFKLNYVFKSLSISYIMASKQWDRFSPEEMMRYIAAFKEIVRDALFLRPGGYTKQGLLEIAQRRGYMGPDKIFQRNNLPVARSLLGRALYLLEHPEDKCNRGDSLPPIKFNPQGTYSLAS